jgi:hypothetical protein
MVINSFSNSSIVGSVWANATRTLTASPEGYTVTSLDTATLAATTTLDLTPAAGKIRVVMFVDTTGLAVLQYGLKNGGTSRLITGVAAHPPVMMVGNSTWGPAVFNSSAGGIGPLTYSGYDFTAI